MVMKRIGTIDGDELIEYRFDSIWSLIEYLKTGPDNRLFREKSSQTGSYDFTGTQSYAEAESLCLYGGDKNDFEKFMYLKESLDDTLAEKRTRTMQFNDFVGDVPNVPLYLMGYPLNMIRQRREELSEDKVIDIYFNVSVPAYTTRQQIFNRGVIALSLIDYLEGLGYKVNLHLFELSTKEGQVCLYEFDLKNLDEATDYRNLFFPLTHPSFLRRIIFRLMEKTPELTSEWTYGYGTPASRSLIEKVFNVSEGNKFIFYSPSDMGIYGEDLEADFETCISRMGVKRKVEEDKRNNDKR